MARKILLKDNGLSNQPNTPDGYLFLGLTGNSLGLKLGATISQVGGDTTGLVRRKKPGIYTFTQTWFNPGTPLGTVNSNSQYYYPFLIDENLTITDMEVDLSTAGSLGSKFILAVYSNDGYNGVGNLLAQTTEGDGTDTLNQLLPLDINLNLTPGLYFYMVSASANMTFRSIPSSCLPNVLESSSNLSTGPYIGYLGSEVYSPTSSTTPSFLSPLSTLNIPRVNFHIQ